MAEADEHWDERLSDDTTRAGDNYSHVEASPPSGSMIWRTLAAGPVALGQHEMRSVLSYRLAITTVASGALQTPLASGFGALYPLLMPRPAKYDEGRILKAAASLVAARGPGAATITAIGTAIGAPDGSIYHRFRSGDELLGRLWLTKAEFFQNRWAKALHEPNPRRTGIARGSVISELAISLSGLLPIDYRQILNSRRPPGAPGLI